jgi:hypothetical protein
MAAQRDPRVTDLSRYRRDRARAERAAQQKKPAGSDEPILGRRPRAGLFLVLVIVVLVALWFLGRH